MEKTLIFRYLVLLCRVEIAKFISRGQFFVEIQIFSLAFYKKCAWDSFNFCKINCEKGCIILQNQC